MARTEGPDGGTNGAESEQAVPTPIHIWKPLPLLRSIQWLPETLPPPGEREGGYDVFIMQPALEDLLEHVWTAPPDEEPFGFLIGDLCEDPEAECRYVQVGGIVRSRLSLVEDSAQQISPEAQIALQLEVDRRRGVLAGWYHRHTGGAVELSERDVATHQRLFRRPWQVAVLVVTDPSDPRGGVFRRTARGFSPSEPLPFYELVRTESLRGRGVRCSCLDWTNVRAEEAVVRELPARVAEVRRATEEVAERQAAAGWAEREEAERRTAEEEKAHLAAEEKEREEAERRAAAQAERQAAAERAEREEAERRAAAQKEAGRQAAAQEEAAARRAARASEERATARAQARVQPAPEEGADRVPAPPVVVAPERRRRRRRPAWLRRATIVAAGVVVVGVVAVGLAAVVRWAGEGEPFPAQIQAPPEQAGAAPGDPPAEPEVGAGEEGGPDTSLPAGEDPSVAGGDDATSPPLARLDRLAADLSGALEIYREVNRSRVAGRAGCTELQTAYVRVEQAWIDYNVSGRGPVGDAMDEARRARDLRLYEGVQGIERLFGAAGCPRP